MRFFPQEMDRTIRAHRHVSGWRAVLAALIGLAGALLVLGIGMYFA